MAASNVASDSETSVRATFRTARRSMIDSPASSNNCVTRSARSRTSGAVDIAFASLADS
jgi:hypothetical protein